MELHFFLKNHRYHGSHNRGFTLIEMLIALAIGASVAVMSYSALKSAINSEERVSKVTQQVDEVDRVWQYIGRDLLYAAERTWSGRSGEKKSPMIGVFGDRLSQSDVLVASEDDYLLQFVRGNRGNLLNQARSDLYMVGYRLTQTEGEDTKSLWRDSWSPVDGSGDPTVQKRRLLDGIKTLSFRYLPTSFQSLEDGAWISGWPADGEFSAKLPAAVEITIESLSMGEVTRRFALSASDE